MKILIIHGFEGTSESNFFPWLKKELENLGDEVFVPNLPNSGSPVYEETMTFLEDLTKDFGENDTIVGHSLGSKFALKLAENMKLKNLIIVAPVTENNLDFKNIRSRWVGSDVDSLEKVTEIPLNLQKITATNKAIFLSDDDIGIPISTKDIFDDSWAKFVLNGKGHYQKKEIPEILEKLKVFRKIK